MARDIEEIATHFVLALPISHERLRDLPSTLESVIGAIRAEGMNRRDTFRYPDDFRNPGLIVAQYCLVISSESIPSTYPGVKRHEDYLSLVIPLGGDNRTRVPEILERMIEPLMKSINDGPQEVRGSDGVLHALVEFKPKLMRCASQNISR